MRLVISKTIREIELDPLKKQISFEELKDVARKSLLGLGDTIKSTQKIPGMVLKKMYLTTVGGAARSIFLLQLDKKATVFVMLRLKKDKRVGENMTVNNPEFTKALQRNLGVVLSDIDSKQFDVIEL